MHSLQKYLHKVLRKLYFFLNWQILENKKKQNKKLHTQVFRHCYVQHMRKISGKNIKPYFSWSSWKSSFFKQETLLFCKELVFVKNHLSVFFSGLLGKFPPGRLPSQKIAPDPKPNQNPYPSTGEFVGGNCTGGTFPVTFQCRTSIIKQ